MLILMYKKRDNFVIFSSSSQYSNISGMLHMKANTHTHKQVYQLRHAERRPARAVPNCNRLRHTLALNYNYRVGDEVGVEAIGRPRFSFGLFLDRRPVAIGDGVVVSVLHVVLGTTGEVPVGATVLHLEA